MPSVIHGMPSVLGPFRGRSAKLRDEQMLKANIHVNQSMMFSLGF